MSRSFFARGQSSSSPRDNSPLLPQHRNSVSLQTLSPRDDSSRTRSPAASPSPPPSFYRSKFNDASPNQAENAVLYSDHSPSPSRIKGKGKERDFDGPRVQFQGPPAPIAQSVLLPTHQRGDARHSSPSGFQSRNSNSKLQARQSSSGMDPLLIIERKERAIQQELQVLLDAQSTGLVRGFGGGLSSDGASDAGSATPTTSSAAERSRSREEGGGYVPVRQPKKKVLSLRGARKGLLKDMATLAGVKEEESLVLDAEIKRRERVLEQTSRWQEKMEAMRGQLESYSEMRHDVRGGGEESAEILALQKEERGIDGEIRDLEDRLMQLRARKNWLGERIREGINRREARLSSYRGALKEVESDVKEFLRRPPVARSIVMGKEEGFAALPPDRRTLGMVSEWWGKEVAALSDRKSLVEAEKGALEEGAEIWSSTMETVTTFEEDLRKQMTANKAQDNAGLREQVGKMRDVIDKLERNLGVAESKHWNLLVCAIGAELEAFKEGEGILKGALGMSSSSGGRESVENEDTFYSTEDGVNGLEVTTEGLKEGSKKEEVLAREDSREESEDDGPNLAELMVDHTSREEAGVD
jgi:hypothetical protein